MDFTLVGLWNEMGFTARAVVVVLVVMSLYALAIAGERLLTFRRGRASLAATSRRWRRWSRRPDGCARRSVSRKSSSAARWPR